MPDEETVNLWAAMQRLRNDMREKTERLAPTNSKDDLLLVLDELRARLRVEAAKEAAGE